MTITIDNQLEPVYGLHSISDDVHIRRRENLKPYALVSSGRKIEGVIKYLSPIAPWTLAEKLAGPSSINNGGIEVDFGVFKITFDEVVWSGSRSSSPLSDNQTKIDKYNNPEKFLNDFYVGQTIGEIWGYETEGFFIDAADIASSVSASYASAYIAAAAAA